MKKTILLILLFSSTVLAASLFNAFNSGELSPLVKYRIDLEKRQMGVETLENFLVKQQGAAFRRPGTEYIYTVKDSNHTPRLIPFIYSIGDAYVVEAGDEYARFHRTVDGNSGVILTGAGTEDLSDVNDNLISHWTMNGNEGSTTVTDEVDSNDGTADTNTISLYYQYGAAGSCFDLDGEHYITVSDNNDFSFDDSGDNPFTIASWVFPSDTNIIQEIFSKWQEGSNSEYRLYLDTDLKPTLELSGPTANLEPNCVSQWKLNENTTSTAVDDAMEEVDGVATTNTSNLATAGKIGGAFDFDSQYVVEVNDNAAYSFGDGTTDSPFSVAAWVYHTPIASEKVILAKLDITAGATAQEWYMSKPAEGTILFMCVDESKNGYIQRRSSAMSAGWNFAVATYDGNSVYTGINIYINGSLDNDSGSLTGTYTAMEDLATKVTIGAHYATGGAVYGLWNDKIDNPMIFNKELSLAEIQYLYNAGLGTEELVAGSTVYAKADEAITDNQWSFITATYDSTGGVAAANGITLYVDGAEVNSTAYNNADYTAMPNTDANVLIGAEYDSSGDEQKFLDGKIDNVAIFGDDLNSVEIASLYSTTPYEIDTVYDVNDLRQVTFIQKNDIMYICHPNYPTQKLSRYAHTQWEIEDANWIWGPFLGDNDEDDVNITPSATTGTITLTANGDLFSPEHEGALWKITEKQTTTYLKETINGADADTDTNSLPIQGEYLLKLVGNAAYDGTVILEKSEDDGTTWIPVYQRPSVAVAYDVEYAGDEAEAGWEYKVITENQTAGSVKMTLTVYNAYIDGYVLITSYTSPTVVNARVISELAGITATNRWAEGAWSDYRGYPRTVGLSQNRLCLAGADYLPNTFYASVSGDFENMRTSTLDTGAIVYEVGSARQNAILWLQDKQGILAGTSDSLIRIFSQSNSSTLTGDSIGSERQSQTGSGDLQAQLLGDSVIFVGRNYRKVFDSIYNLQSESFISPELTVYAEHITDPCILEVAVQSNPDPILWFVIGDGNCVTLTYNPSQGVVAWAEHSTDGDFESVAVVPGDTEDEVWFCVKRTIDGNDLRYIEKLKEQDWGDDPNDCWFVDSGLEYNSTETNSITGLSHLEGEEVQIFYDGNSVQTATVSGGAISLDPNVTRALIGKGYTSTLITFPVELAMQSGSSIGYKKKVYEVAGCFYKSMCGEYGYLAEYTDGTMYPIPFSSWPDALIGTDAPFTGQIRLPMDSGNDYEPRLKFIQDEPYPFNLTALSIKLGVSEN